MWAIKPVVGVLGAVIGCLIFLAAGELIYPTAKAQTGTAGTTNSPEQPMPPSDNRRGNFSEGQQGGSNSQTYIEQRLPQRHIEPDKIKQLSSALAKSQIPVMIVQLGEIESSTYASDIRSAIKDSGTKWDFVQVGSMSPPPYGVLVGPKSDNAIAIKDMLSQAGVAATVTESTPPMPGSADRPGYVKIVVGLQDPRQ